MSALTFARRARPDGSCPKNPVRRDSRASGGEWERNFAVCMSPGELARYPRVLRAHRGRLRRAWWAMPLAERRTDDGRAAAPPTELHMSVLEALTAMAAGGRRLLAVSYGELANRARCSTSAVHQAIARLARAGMIAWQRRCRPTGAEPAFGEPQWEQDVNLYRLLWPAGVKRQMARAGAEEDARRAKRVDAGAARRRQAVREGVEEGLRPKPPPAPPAGRPDATGEVERLRAALAARPIVRHVSRE